MTTFATVMRFADSKSLTRTHTHTTRCTGNKVLFCDNSSFSLELLHDRLHDANTHNSIHNGFPATFRSLVIHCKCQSCPELCYIQGQNPRNKAAWCRLLDNVQLKNGLIWQYRMAKIRTVTKNGNMMALFHSLIRNYTATCPIKLSGPQINKLTHPHVYIGYRIAFFSSFG